ncbi:A-kinase anchor protein 10, mitochondrial [Daktulosphaira vitifoliae]|uniref:A-kinase anchor protein 10, mitochondrial n=1 Tax=Daktulosphaira vitifoliae TaxID=58002 RepID=UPI0021AADD46|nr:A-kinase anchor protein 10, mitochondrial [Daktulosphaira vitifoliae]
MLNFWKNIQSKKNSSILPNNNSNIPLCISENGTLPLKNYVFEEYELFPLEKCRLSLRFSEALESDNTSILSLFKQFLDHKNLLSLYQLYMELYRHSKINDELLHQNTIKIITHHQIDIPDSITNKLNLKGQNLDCDDSKIVIDKINVILEEYWNSFVQTDMFCKYQVDILTSGKVTLGDILLSDGLLSYFMEFLDGEGCRSLVEFWLATCNFERCVIQFKNESFDYELAQNDAIYIYEKYLSLQATCALGFSDEVRISVEESMCPVDISSQSASMLGQCFNSAVLIVLSFLRHKCLNPFLSSQHYVRYLSELIKSGNFYQSSSQDNDSSSSSISEYSVNSKRSMSSFLPYSASTDSLWRKRQQSGLSFGRVDPYGRFERNIEPDPDKNKESGIKRMMKKFVNKDGAKIQEDMAWQIAEMIVKDVTSITMANNYGDSDIE